MFNRELSKGYRHVEPQATHVISCRGTIYEFHQCVLKDISKHEAGLASCHPLMLLFCVVDHRNMFLLHLCYCVEFRNSRSNHTSVFMEIYQNNLTLTSRISRPLKVIAADTDRSDTYDLV